jgi:hypothetical protein
MTHHVDLILKKGFLWRLDVFPFIIFYSLVFAIIEPVEEGLWRDLALIGLIFLNCIVYLMSHWSAYLKRHIQFFRSDKINSA